jgi:integrase
MRLWGIEYRNALDGKRYRQRAGATTKAEAEGLLRKAMSEIAQARIAGARSVEQLKGVRFGDFADGAYASHIKTAKTVHGKARDEQIIKALKPSFGGMLLRDISTAAVREYAHKRLSGAIGRKAKPSTVNRELSCLSAIFREAVKMEYTTDNPVRRVEKYREDNFRLRYLSDDEERALLVYAPAEIRPILVTAIHTGLRKEELLSLTWAEVDMEKRLVRVKAGKTGKVRYVPLNDVAHDTLKTAPRYALDPGTPVFANPETKERWCDLKPVWYRHVAPALKRAGIPHLRFHDLRHTFASRLVQRGIPLNTVRELLGHGSMVMTLRYAHLAPSNLREAVDVLVQTDSQAQVGKNRANRRAPRATAT